MAVRSLQNSQRLLARLVGQQQAALASSQAQQEGGRREKEQKGHRSHGAWGAAAGLGLGLVGFSSLPLLADEKKDKTVFGKTKADRVRQYATADNVFDHFASYQVVSDTGESYKESSRDDKSLHQTFPTRQEDNDDEHPQLLQRDDTRQLSRHHHHHHRLHHHHHHQ